MPARRRHVPSLLLVAGTLSATGVDAQVAQELRDTLPNPVRVRAVRVTAPAVEPGSALPNVGPDATRYGRRSDWLAPPVGAQALNAARQAFGRAPGVMVWEQDMSGVQTSVAVRGLSPNRSWEFNTRQDGADIAADPFGYPEAYYTPPVEAVDRIEIVRGAASLQYGPQVGGLLNYVMRRGREDVPVALDLAQRGGTGRLAATTASLGGQVAGFNWLALGTVRQGDGWRTLGEFRQATGALRAAWSPSPRATLTASVTRMAYRIRQPGGLTEAQFAADARQAMRPRDWFGAPWTIPQIALDARLAPATRLRVSAFGLLGERNSLGILAPPTVLDSGATPRRLDRDAYRNVGVEARLVHGATLAGRPATLAAGLRWSRGLTSRWRARGADGADFALGETGPRTLDLAFDTRNAAAYAELGIEVVPGLTVSPGVRLERLAMDGAGSWSPAGSAFLPAGRPVAVAGTRVTRVPLVGVGVSWMLGGGLEGYGNLAQSFRPVTFAEQYPTDLVGVDPALRPARGLTADVGVRRATGAGVTFDLGAFWLRYGDRIGVVGGAALGADADRFPAGVRRNVGTSTHYGLEATADMDLTGLASRVGAPGRLAWWTSAARTVAAYTAGPLAGRQVEHAPAWIVRSGLTWRAGGATATLQGNWVAGAWSDASNTRWRADGLQGWIPGYRVADATLRVPLGGVAVEATVQNLFDARYFTRRATGYPGPGIVPGDGRVLIAGLVVGR